jgi:phosphoglycolate phosphatase
MMNKGIIVFDMDGTLINSMDDHAKIFSTILNRWYEIPITLSKKIYFQTAGQPLNIQYSKVLNFITIPNIKIRSENEFIEEFWSGVVKKKPKLFPHTIAILEILQKAGYILCLSTGCSKFVMEKKLQDSKIEHFFKIKMASDYDSPNGLKKGKDHINYLLKTLKISLNSFVERSIFIGDGTAEMELSNNYGILAIGITSTNSSKILRKAGASIVIGNLFEILELLIDPYNLRSLEDVKKTLIQNKIVE